MPIPIEDMIVSTAADLMVLSGYSAFTYSRLAEALGTNRASIHHHFPTKENLTVAVLIAHRERLISSTKLLDAQVQNPLNRLQAHMRQYGGNITGATSAFCVAALLGTEMPSLPATVQAEIRLHFHVLAGWFETVLRVGVEERVFTLDAAPEVEAQVLMAIIHGAMLSTRACNDPALFIALTEAALGRVSERFDPASSLALPDAFQVNQ